MQPQLLPSALTVQWLMSASGSYSRAARSLESDIQNSDLEDIQMCRLINDRIMTVRRRCRAADPYLAGDPFTSQDFWKIPKSIFSIFYISIFYFIFIQIYLIYFLYIFKINSFF